MKGAKGGKRDRIISFLFSKRNQEEKTEKEELEQNELLKQKEKIEGRKKIYDDDKVKADNLESNIDHVTVLDKSEPSNEKHISGSTTTIVDTPIIDKSEPSNEKQVSGNTKTVIDTPIVDRSEPSNEKKQTRPFTTTTYTPVTDTSEPAKERKPFDNQEIVSDRPVKSNEIHSSFGGGTSGNRTSDTEEHEITITEEKEIKQNAEQLFLEKSVINSLERMIKEDLYELEQIQYELEVLSKKEEDEVLKEEVEQLRQRLDNLIAKFERLKSIYYSSEELDKFKIDSDLLYDSVLDYKENFKDANLFEIAQAEISAIESYVSLLSQISVIESFTDELDQKIDDKLNRFEIRDEQFEQMKLNYEDVDALTEVIEKFNTEQESILKNMEEKIENSVKTSHEIQRTVQLVPHFERLFESALMISASRKIPPTPHGNILKTALMISAISNASHFLETRDRTKEITKIKYYDYSADLNNIRGEISSVLDKMENAFDDIDVIREKFKKECGQYASQIKEFDEFMKNLDRIEADLKLKQSIARKYDKDFEKMLQKNDIKVKKLGALENAEAA